jgi:hypothetical protein
VPRKIKIHLSISMSPGLIQSRELTTKPNMFCRYGSLSRTQLLLVLLFCQIQPDVIKVKPACATLSTILTSNTNGHILDLRKIHTCITENTKRNIPLLPGVLLHCIGIVRTLNGLFDATTRLAPSLLFLQYANFALIDPSPSAKNNGSSAAYFTPCRISLLHIIS